MAEEGGEWGRGTYTKSMRIKNPNTKVAPPISESFTVLRNFEDSDRFLTHRPSLDKRPPFRIPQTHKRFLRDLLREGFALFLVEIGGD